jgi:hypothetical protein
MEPMLNTTTSSSPPPPPLQLPKSKLEYEIPLGVIDIHFNHHHKKSLKSTIPEILSIL